MADVKFLANLDVDGNISLTAGSGYQIKNATFESLTADPTTNNFEGRMIYRSDTNQVRFYNGSAWTSIAGDITGVTAGSGLGGGGNSGAVTLSVNVDDTTIEISSDTVQAKTAAIADGGTGLATADQIHTFVTGQGYLTAHPNISAATSSNNSGRTYIQDITLDSNGHVTGLATATETVTNSFRTVTAGGNTLGASETLAFTAGSNVTITESAGAVTIAATDTNTQLSNEQVQDIVGGMLTGNTETGITVTYQDSDGTIDFVVDDIASVTVADNTTNANQPLLFVADAGSGQEIRVDGSASDAVVYNPSTQTLTVKNLTVSGTQTTNNVEIIETSNGVVFEGTTADAFETTLTAADPTADRDIVLPNKSGTVALTSDLPGNATSTTPGKARVTAGGGIDVSVSSGNFTVSAEDSSASNKGVVIVAAGEGIDVTYSSGTATVAAEDASTSNKGVVELATTAEALAGSDTSRAVTPAGLAARSYRAAIGDGTATSIAVTHSLGTRDVVVQLYDASSYETVYAQVVRTSTSVVTVDFNTAPTTGDVIVLVTKVD